jgi:AcrR family transcriptional regulator
MTGMKKNETTGHRSPTGAAVLQEHVTTAIARAALEELAEVGYWRMSMDSVARRAGVGKAAIYRRWPSKQSMVIAIIADIGIGVNEAPDTGSLHGDIEAFLTTNAEHLHQPLPSRIMLDIHAEMVRDTELARAIRTTLQEPRRKKVDEILRRAQTRGELAPNIDHELAMDLLAGPLYWHFIIDRAAFSADYIKRLTDMTLAALKNDALVLHDLD